MLDTWSTRAPRNIFVSLFGFLQQTKKKSSDWKHIGKDFYLSDLFDFGASFANQRTALAPWENKPECHRWLACHSAVCHRSANILGENWKICLFVFCHSDSKKVSYIWQCCFCCGPVVFIHNTCRIVVRRSVVQCIIYAMQHLSQQHVCANALLHLLKLLCDHGERSEDAFCWSCDGDYSLWRWSLWYVDACTTLETQVTSPSLFQHYILQGMCVPTHDFPEFLARGMFKLMLTSSLIFFTVSPFWIHEESHGIKE